MQNPGYLVLALGALSLAACSEGGGAESILSDVGHWRHMRDAEKTYPDKTPMEARKQWARDHLTAAMENAETDEIKRVIAARFYLGYSLMNGRAIPAYCEQMNIEVTPYTEKFLKINRAEERSLDAVLESQGVSRDEAWEKHKRFFMSAAKNDLMKAGGHSKGSYGVCKDLKEKPELVTPAMRFGKQFPRVSFVLNSDV